MPYYYDIGTWMDKHKHQLDELNQICQDQVLESTDQATHEADLKRFLAEHKDDFKEEHKKVVDEAKENYEVEIGYSPASLEEAKQSPKPVPTFEEWCNDEGIYLDFEQWFDEEGKEDELRGQFDNDRCPDDYYPIWNTIWEFPSHMSAENLNELDIPGLVFFDAEYYTDYNEDGEYGSEIEKDTMVGLTTCGMDMSPSLYYAYFMHSSVPCRKTSILNKILSCGVDYYKYVVGSEHFFRLMQKVGKRLIEKYGAESRRRYKEFDESINRLSKLRDEGKLDQLETGLMAFSALFKTKRPMDKKDRY